MVQVRLLLLLPLPVFPIFLIKFLLFQEVEDAALYLGISLSFSLEGGTPTAPRSNKLLIQKVVQKLPVIQKPKVVQKPASALISSSELPILPVKKERVVEEVEKTVQETSKSKLRTKCALCPKSFSRKRHLKRHIATKHEDDEGKQFVSYTEYNCNKCEKGFHTGRKLKRHIRSHNVTESGSYKCEVCQKRFPSGSSLFMHRNIHLEEMPFKCEDCDKGFAQKGNFKAHIKKHHNAELDDVLSESLIDVDTAETIEVEVDFSGSLEEEVELDAANKRGVIVKQYKCDKCDKTFLTGLKLKKHNRSHTGSGEYKCEVCQKWFPSSSSLYLHRNIHLDTKPFKCEDCQMGFNQKGNLKAHFQKYHDKEPSVMLSENFDSILVREAETVEVEFSGAVEEEVLE